MGVSTANGPEVSTDPASGSAGADQAQSALDAIVSRLTDVERRQERALHDMHLRMANHARLVNVQQVAQPAHPTPVGPPSPKSEIWLPLSDEEPWDQNSAEALVALYQPAPRDSAIRRRTESFRVPAAATVPAASAATAAGLSASDRTWIESQLAGLAKIVEASRADAVTKSSLDGVTSRIDGLEHRLDMALAGVASRADVEAFSVAEERIEMLAKQLAEAQSQMQRVSELEERILDIGDHLDQAGLAAPQANIDIEAFVTAAVERASTLLASKSGAAPADAARLDELQHVVSELIDQSQSGKSEAETAMETLQEAVIGLIDRLDALERKSSDVAAVPHPVAGSTAAALNSDRVVHGLTPKFADATEALEPTTGHTPVHDSHEDAGPVAERRTAPWATEPLDMPAGMEPVQTARPAPPVEAPVSAAPSRPAPASVMDLRRDFRADAFRAKQKAASAEDIGPAAPEIKTHSSATPPSSIAALRDKLEGIAPAPDAKDAKPERAGKSKAPSNSTAVMGLAALLFAGIGYVGVDTVMTWQAATTKADVAPATPKAMPLTKSGAPAEPSHEPPGLLPTTGEGTPASKKASEGGDGSIPVGQKAPAPGKSSARPDAPAGQLLPPGGDHVVRAPQPIAGSSGIAIANSGRQFTPEDLMRMQQSRQMAAASSAVGENAVLKPSQAVPVLPASVDPASAAAASAGDPSRAGYAVHMRDLPPAAVGPLSLRVAAAKGDPSAEFEVAARLAEGKGIKQDFVQALEWYQRSATKGFAPAQYRVATLFERGLGTKADIARARIWYKRAAEQGNVKAMHNLAVLSASRDSTTPDYPTAAHWFMEAAQRGLSDSQFNLGVLFENGLGVAKDNKQAYKWLALAARGGDKEALRRRDLAAQKLDPADRQDVDQELATWKSQPVPPAINDAAVAGNAWRERDGEASRQN